MHCLGTNVQVPSGDSWEVEGHQVDAPPQLITVLEGMADTEEAGEVLHTLMLNSAAKAKQPDRDWP